jgi:hypothetical protein
MALTLAQLLGTPAFADARDLDRAITIGKKASGTTTAIAAGRVVFIGSTGGNWAIATSGSTGRMGVVPNLAPLNVDADTSIAVIDSPGAEIYVEANGAILANSEVVADTGGKVKARSTETSGIVGKYMGHYGEGSGLGNAPTTAAAGEAVRISIKGGGVA